VTSRPRLLFLSQTLPYPLDSGGWIRTYHVLRLLAESFDVTLLAFERAAAPGYDRAQSVAELARLCEVSTFRVPQFDSRPRLLWDHLRSLATRRTYTHFMYDCDALRERLRALLRDPGFDIVHCNALDMATYLPDCSGAPIVSGHLDVESALWRRRSQFERGWLKRRYFAFQAQRREAEERDWAGRVALNVMVSETDREVLASIAPGARFSVVPNGVDVDEYAPEPGVERGCVYVGGTYWSPNLDALDFFAQEILPQLQALRGDTDFPVRWVGSASEREQRHYRERFGIELTGYVDDVRPAMRDSVCNIVPLRSGGGTRVKILNAWAMGKAVVSTSIGCEGLAAVDGENIAVRDDPESFARAIVDFERDPALRERIGAAARRTAVETYSWERIGRDMNPLYRELAGS
jgi:glycosyltransferase involved in cell wall biosynthesis